MDKIGIITFHSAYNYGSVLQAYATQETVKKLGYNTEIINYRTKEQKRIYSNIKFCNGFKDFIRDVTLLPVYSKRKLRAKKFEEFIANMQLSEICRIPKDVIKIWSQYPVIISGSDQIWNKHSLELENVGWEYMDPYLLNGYKGGKISYASSIANMNPNELKKILNKIDDFSYVSTRESVSSEALSKMVNNNISIVLDPTFLLKNKDWINSFNLKKKKEKYILYYSLRGINGFNEIKDTLVYLSKQYNCKILTITPFCFINKNSIFEPHPEYGPIDFLNAIYNSELVVTDSFHGTVLSVNFEKDFFSICKNNGSEFRKTDILKRIDLEDRIIHNVLDIQENNFKIIDYNVINIKLDKLREESLNYLKVALGDCMDGKNM